MPRVQCGCDCDVPTDTGCHGPCDDCSEPSHRDVAFEAYWGTCLDGEWTGLSGAKGDKCPNGHAVPPAPAYRCTECGGLGGAGGGYTLGGTDWSVCDEDAVLARFGLQRIPGRNPNLPPGGKEEMASVCQPRACCKTRDMDAHASDCPAWFL